MEQENRQSDNMLGLAKAVAGLGQTQASPWERAHRELDAMRDGLLRCREEAQQRGRVAEREIAEIDNALSRITPPVPPSIPVGVGNGVNSKPW